MKPRRRDAIATDISQVVRDIILNWAVASGALPRRLRPRLLSALGQDVHPTAVLNPGMFLGAWSGLTIGERTFVNYGCFFDLGAPIALGKCLGIGYETMFVTCSHHVGPEWNRTGEAHNLPIVVEDGCWLGSRVVVMPGVTIGRGCVVASGSVVIADCEPNSLYAGVPAQLKRRLTATDGRSAAQDRY